MKNLFLFVFLISLAACKNDGSKVSTETALTPEEVKPQFDKRLPDACTLLSENVVAEVIGESKGAVEIKDGSHAQNLFSRACFYKWEDPGVKNAGIMVQVMINPVEDDEPDYLSIYIASKKSNGEQSMSGDRVVYQDFDGFGDDGAYSYEFHKYMWRQGNEYSYMIAFNTVMTAEEEMAAARRIASEIMKKVN